MWKGVARIIRTNGLDPLGLRKGKGKIYEKKPIVVIQVTDMSMLRLTVGEARLEYFRKADKERWIKNYMGENSTLRLREIINRR